ncbi:HSP70-5 [Symbiodinium microadriaticum]|nr:HSP70-5 [Symbiodinium microadriaticum]
MKRAADAALGCDCKKAVVTVPAHFNDQQRQATKDAGRIAGLEVVRIINEPTAAALAYGLHASGVEGASRQNRANVLIFDLGGGTFDVSVLSMEGGVFAVKASLVAVKSSTRSMQRIRRACETAKRNLSVSQEVEIEIDALIDGSEPFNITVTRGQFESMCADLFTRCMDTVRLVLRDAKATVDEEQLFGHFNGRITLCKSINPDEAVAYGAAVQGAILQSGGTGGGQALQGVCTDLVLLDVAPLSLGIELEGHAMSVLIPRNTPIPCVKSREYTTVDDWQTEIDVRLTLLLVVVFEGERPHTSANNKLGEFQITGVQRARRGEPKVEVEFQMDANGILHVTARDKVTGANATANIKADRGRLTEEDIERMIADAERYREEDEALSRKIHLRNALEEAVYRVKSACTDSNDIRGITDLDDYLDWLEYDSEAASEAEVQAKCDELFKRYGVRVVPGSTTDAI